MNSENKASRYFSICMVPHVCPTIYLRVLKILQEGRHLTYHAEINSFTPQPICLAKETAYRVDNRQEKQHFPQQASPSSQGDCQRRDHTTPSITKQGHFLHTCYIDINIYTCTVSYYLNAFASYMGTVYMHL